MMFVLRCFRRRRRRPRRRRTSRCVVMRSELSHFPHHTRFTHPSISLCGDEPHHNQVVGFTARPARACAAAGAAERTGRRGRRSGCGGGGGQWTQTGLRAQHEREERVGGLTREVETPSPSYSPHDHMILRVDRVDSHGRWKRPCLLTAHMTI
jgi:hypothetical protein